ncbi:hypothetical protein C6497_09245 [Candidatus Poribacteria bacterium]|nr:MAG: hypothetical protein C6497_09245 [Candidatus Poribacteria bacterium]
MKSISPVLLCFVFILLISCQQEQGNYTTVHQKGRYIYGIWKAPKKEIVSNVIPIVSNKIRSNSSNNPINKPLPYITTAAPELLLPKNEETDDWVHAGTPSTYNTDTLYYDRFVSPDIYYKYGFQRQAEVEYHSPKHRSIPLILVEVFDMGSPENAFGIYSVYSYSHQDFEWIGCKAIISPRYIRFWKGKYFVQIESYEIATPIRSGMIELAKVIATNIKDTPKEIPLFNLLPTPHINGSEKYFTNNWTLRFIDKSLPKIIPELTDGTVGISAKYYDKQNKNSLNPYTVFLLHFPDVSKAESAFSVFRTDLMTDKITIIDSINGGITINEQLIKQ